MANTFLKAREIANAMLVRLEENLIMPMLSNRQYSDTFANKGDTIQIPRPVYGLAEDFTSSISIQDIENTAVNVQMNKLVDYSVAVTSLEEAIDSYNFQNQVIIPGAQAINEKINKEMLALAKKVPYFSGTAGTTPDALEDFAAIRSALNKQKVPVTNRKGVWDVDADSKFTLIDAIVNAEKSGSTMALREGSIGRIQGFDNYWAQSVYVHTAGGYTALTDVTATVDVDNNAVDTDGFIYSVATLTSAAGTSTAKLLEGDLLTIDGKTYVVWEDTLSASSGVVSVKLYPSLTADITDEAVTFADQTAGGHVANIGFHPNAFVFVNKPLKPAQGTDSYTVTSPTSGVSLRVTISYDQTQKKQVISIDTLYGIKCVFPELAHVRLG